MVLLRMSPSWPLPKSRLIQHPLRHVAGNALVGFLYCRLGLAWPSLACLDLSVDPGPQILNTCKSSQIHITSKTNTNSKNHRHGDTYFISGVNSGKRVGLANWLRVTLSGMGGGGGYKNVLFLVYFHSLLQDSLETSLEHSSASSSHLELSCVPQHLYCVFARASLGEGASFAPVYIPTKTREIMQGYKGTVSRDLYELQVL